MALTAQFAYITSSQFGTLLQQLLIFMLQLWYNTALFRDTFNRLSTTGIRGRIQKLLIRKSVV